MAVALGRSLPGQQGCGSARMTHTLVIHRKSFEFEDASSLQSLYPSSPTENGTESQPKFGSKSTLEENAYEDIVGKQGPRRAGLSVVPQKRGCGKAFPGPASLSLGRCGPTSGTSQGKGHQRKRLTKD